MSDGQIEGFRKLFDELMRYCVRRGIGFTDAQDLVGSSLEATLRRYDASRGSLGALAQVTLENRVKNFWRDRKTLVPIEGAGDVEDPGTRPDAFDESAHDQERLRTIMAELTPEERGFLLVLQSVLDEMDQRAISEAARRMGITPAKGWDLFRKIQRKAVRKTAKRDHGVRVSKAKMPPAADRSMDDSMPMALEVNEMSATYPAPAAAPVPEAVSAEVRALAALTALDDAFNRFYAGLRGESRAAVRETM